MASVSDAARFSLETSAPELNELLNKKIFNREQINKIARARSDFEHHINAPGTGLDKWNRYIKYETTFLKLRRERARKMGVKGLNHAGAGRVFRVFDGAVRKFPGNVDLWLDYVKFAEHEKAFSRVAEILTRALRLLAGESKLWIYAGRYAYGTHRDINQARQFLQRGLRFNSKDLDLWLTYLELEMKYLDSIWARQELLSGGIGGAPEPSSRDGPELDKIQLPVGPMATSNVLTKALDATKVGPYDTNSVTLDPSTAPPIVNGAIPEAVFRGIMTAFPENSLVLLKAYAVASEAVISGHGAIYRNLILERIQETMFEVHRKMVEFETVPECQLFWVTHMLNYMFLGTPESVAKMERRLDFAHTMLNEYTGQDYNNYWASMVIAVSQREALFRVKGQNAPILKEHQRVMDNVTRGLATELIQNTEGEMMDALLNCLAAHLQYMEDADAFRACMTGIRIFFMHVERWRTLPTSSERTGDVNTALRRTAVVFLSALKNDRMAKKWDETQLRRLELCTRYSFEYWRNSDSDDETDERNEGEGDEENDEDANGEANGEANNEADIEADEGDEEANKAKRKASEEA